jgi:FlgN protein
VNGEALRQLIAVLRRQADSLESALALTEQQTSAIARRDVEQVTALSMSLERELVDGQVLEERRIGFAGELAAALGVEPGETTLKTLANALPRDEGRQLLRAGDTVIRAVERLARQSAANRALLEHELAVIDQVVRIAHRGDRSTYGGRGTYAAETISLLDAKA